MELVGRLRRRVMSSPRIELVRFEPIRADLAVPSGEPRRLCLSTRVERGKRRASAALGPAPPLHL
jgi:hypothetical protein